MYIIFTEWTGEKVHTNNYVVFVSIISSVHLYHMQEVLLGVKTSTKDKYTNGKKSTSMVFQYTCIYN